MHWGFLVPLVLFFVGGVVAGIGAAIRARQRSRGLRGKPVAPLISASLGAFVLCALTVTPLLTGRL